MTAERIARLRAPSTLRPVAAAWRRYVTRTMNTELDRIALLVQPPPGQPSDAAGEAQ